MAVNSWVCLLVTLGGLAAAGCRPVASAGGRAGGGGSGGTAGATDAGGAVEDAGLASDGGDADGARNDGSPGTQPPGALRPLPYPDEVLCPPAELSPVEGRLSAAFASQCAGCHGPGGAGQGPFPSLHKVADLDSFLKTVREGRKDMPPFDERAVSVEQLTADFNLLRAGSAGATQTDADCGPGFRALPVSSAESRATRIRRGMVAYRKEGPKGSCAGCHSVAALDLAFIGFSDANILRRAIPQVGVEDARAVVELVHALREQHQIDRPLHPRRFRFLQPGHQVLPEGTGSTYPGMTPGERDARRDISFARLLADQIRLRLTGDPIRTVDQARAAEKQLLELDLRQLPVGVPFPRWTEDGFHGSASNVPNEWVAMLARRPAPGHEASWQALVDTYAQDPSDANLWRMYEAIETHTGGDDDAAHAARWSLRKYQALQVATHLLVNRTLDLPDSFADGAVADPQERRARAIARNPFWRVGEAIRQNPLNCNQPDPCTKFPPALDGTLNPGDEARERQSYEEKMSWFWMGFALDPALVLTEDSLATVSGDYFLALSQPWYQVHNAFVVATIVTHKANARDYQTVKGVALPGHGRWASPRPFMAFKHSERELHHPPPLDPRYPIHERIWANSFRMYLLLMNDELGRTGQVFDRAQTAANVDFIRQWFGKAIEVGKEHADLDALVTELKTRLGAAAEIGTVGGAY